MHSSADSLSDRRSEKLALAIRFGRIRTILGPQYAFPTAPKGLLSATRAFGFLLFTGASRTRSPKKFRSEQKTANSRRLHSGEYMDGESPHPSSGCFKKS
jgi:hypothetical protein